MKAIKILTTVALAGAMVFTSCNVNDDIIDNNEAQAVKFTSGINALPTTKAAIDGTGNSVWELNDPIGIYMVNHGTTIVAESADNVKYTAAAAGASTSFTASGTAIYYPVNETAKVDFIAYHPHNAAVANYVYPVNVATQTSQTAIDLMYATADKSGAGYNKTDAATAVNFAFSHQLAKLILNVEKGAGVTGNLTSVTITGMNTTASFDLKGTAGLTTPGNQGPITPFTATAGSKYEAILLPVAALGAAHTVEFTVGTETYIWNMSNDITSLAAGSIYTYDITLTKYAVGVSGSITKWTVGDTGTGTAE